MLPFLPCLSPPTGVWPLGRARTRLLLGSLRPQHQPSVWHRVGSQWVGTDWRAAARPGKFRQRAQRRAARPAGGGPASWVRPSMGVSASRLWLSSQTRNLQQLLPPLAQRSKAPGLEKWGGGQGTVDPKGAVLLRKHYSEAAGPSSLRPRGGRAEVGPAALKCSPSPQAKGTHSHGGRGSAQWPRAGALGGERRRLEGLGRRGHTTLSGPDSPRPRVLL